jgi:uncharacterized membrane protein
MYKRLLLFVPFLILFYFLISTLPAHAQNWGGCVDANGVASLNCLPIVFSNIIRAALMFVGSVAVFLLVWAGILFVRSGGDPKQTQNARQMMTYAIIGLILVLSSFGIIYFIAYLTKTNCITQLSFTSCQ